MKGKDTYLIVVRVIMVGVRGKWRGRTKAKDRGEVTEDCDSEEGEEEGSFGSCVSIPRHYYWWEIWSLTNDVKVQLVCLCFITVAVSFFSLLLLSQCSVSNKPNPNVSWDRWLLLSEREFFFFRNDNLLLLFNIY